MLSAKGRYLLMLDADGATRISDIEVLERRLREIEKDGWGIVIGSRFHENILGESRCICVRKWYRVALARAFHSWVTLCVSGFSDTQCGFKLFTRKSGHKIFQSLHIQQWAFDVEVLFVAQRLQIPIAEVPVNWRDVPGSKLHTFSCSLQMARDVLYIRLFYLLGVWSVG